MNIQYNLPNKPLRVLVLNPISEVGEILCNTIMSGRVFGVEQMVDMILLVYSNEENEAQQLKCTINQCGHLCNNSVTIISDLPKLSDADIFIFLTEFPCLTSLNFEKVDEPVVYDSLFLLLKVANNLEYVPPPPEDDTLISVKNHQNMFLQQKPRKPLIVADSIVALDILSTYTKNIPKDSFFCPCGISSDAINILCNYLKIPVNKLNKIYVWGANHKIFHVEVDRPVIVNSDNIRRDCEWEDMSDKEREELGLDATQFNASWLKKEYINKIREATAKKPKGPIYKAVKITELMRYIWTTRRDVDTYDVFYANCGVISDGSVNTIKGLPYILPLILKRETYLVNDYNKDDNHLKREINLMNKAALEHHKALIAYCNKFLERNVIQQLLIPKSSTTLIEDLNMSRTTMVSSAGATSRHMKTRSGKSKRSSTKT